jgi:hypothetical protein
VRHRLTGLEVSGAPVISQSREATEQTEHVNFGTFMKNTLFYDLHRPRGSPCHASRNYRRRDGSGPLHRNSDKCAHCGQLFFRLSRKTPIVNRSDGTSFHVSLVSGPDPEAGSTGGLFSGQMFCNFIYVDDRIGPENNELTIIIRRPGITRSAVIRQVHEAADKVAELFAEGKKLDALYTFDADRLLPGLKS